MSDGLLQHVFENVEGADTQVPNAFLVHLGLLKVSPVVSGLKCVFCCCCSQLEHLYWFINIFVNIVCEKNISAAVFCYVISLRMSETPTCVV